MSIQNLGFLKLYANSFRKTFANTPDPDPKILYLTYRRQFFQWIGHIVVLLLPTDIHFENPQIFATNNQTAAMGAIGCPPFYAINASMQDLQNTTTSVDWYAPCMQSPTGLPWFLQLSHSKMTIWGGDPWCPGPFGPALQRADAKWHYPLARFWSNPRNPSWSNQPWKVILATDGKKQLPPHMFRSM